MSSIIFKIFYIFWNNALWEKHPEGEPSGCKMLYLNYRYLAVLTLTPGPMVEATVQERIY